MKVIFTGLIFLVASACSHHHKEIDHHHHDKKTSCKNCESKSGDQYKMNCAHSVLEGKPHTVENDKFKIEHGGRTYYFASQEKMDKFKENFDENVKRADKRWEKGW